MSDEHGWPDFSHADGHDEHAGPDAGAHDEPLDSPDSPFHDGLFDDHGAEADLDTDLEVDADLGTGHDLDAAESAWDDQYEPGTGHDDEAGHTVVDVTDGHGMGPVGADPDAAPDADQVSLFPPVVDVGPLPEPVDGFPWIDTGSLGLYHAGLLEPPAGEPVDAQPVPAEDLAAYAAEDLPPGVDPWAALADSEDPATSALAKWWQPGG
ncbi:hypothetical protein [Actinoplanes sp. NPDC049599]|uniref:hypothetical protein n=1 Tax=Actinoplanes sp. NPDC049599 TaxID=3363903 RepID=UPI003787D7BF